MSKLQRLVLVVLLVLLVMAFCGCEKVKGDLQQAADTFEAVKNLDNCLDGGLNGNTSACQGGQ